MSDTVEKDKIVMEYKRKYFNGTAQNVFACDQETAYFKLSNKAKRIEAQGAAIYNTQIVMYLKSLEERTGCAGVCRKAYFYPFTNVENGPPTESCLNTIIEDYTGATGTYRRYAGAYIISSVFVFVTWFVAFGVCFRLKWDFRGSPLALGYVIKKVEDEDKL